MVGVEGFEPPTFASQTQRSTRLSYTPLWFSSVKRSAPDASIAATPSVAAGAMLHETTSTALHQKSGAPGEIRTPDHLVRSQVLYPTELRAHG